MTLPRKVTDWPPDALHAWHERVGMMAETSGEVPLEVKRKAAEDVRQAWSRTHS